MAGYMGRTHGKMYACPTLTEIKLSDAEYAEFAAVYWGAQWETIVKDSPVNGTKARALIEEYRAANNLGPLIPVVK